MDSTPVPAPVTKRLSLIEDSINGISDTLSKILVNPGEKPLRIVVAQGDAAQREAFRVEGAVKFPMAALSYNNIHKNHDMSYNSALRRNGIRVRGPQIGGLDYIYQLIPVTLTMSFRYWALDNEDILKFATNWMLAERQAQYMVQNSLIKINIRVKLSEDIPVTPMDYSDYGNVFMIDTSLDIYTYCGDISEMRKITQVGLLVGAIADINNAPTTLTTAATAPVGRNINGLTMEDFAINPESFSS